MYYTGVSQKIIDYLTRGTKFLNGRSPPSSVWAMQKDNLTMTVNNKSGSIVPNDGVGVCVPTHPRKLCHNETPPKIVTQIKFSQIPAPYQSRSTRTNLTPNRVPFT